MKILHTGDLHIGMSNYSKLDPETGLDSRLLDFFNTFDRMIEKALDEKVDAFLFAGDAYKTRDPSPTQQRGFGERIKKIAKAGIPVIMVIGNHDTPNAEGKANTLDIYSALEIDNVYVSRKSEFLNIPTKSGNLQVITCPWVHKNDLKILADKLPNFYKKINPAEPAVLIGHLEVEGASFGSEKGLTLTTDLTIPLAILTDRRLNYVGLGHIHKHQILNKNPLILYAGSPERIDFGEEKEEKGYILVDIAESSSKKQATSFKFLQSGARKFLTIKISLSPDDNDPTQTILTEIKKHDLAEKIVRVIIDIPADLSHELEMDKIKNALSSAFYVAGVSRNMERKDRIILEDTEVGRLMATLVNLPADATELTLDFILHNWHPK